MQFHGKMTTLLIFFAKFVRSAFHLAGFFSISQISSIYVDISEVFSGPYSSVFGLNTGNYGPEKTPYLDTFHSVMC